MVSRTQHEMDSAAVEAEAAEAALARAARNAKRAAAGETLEENVDEAIDGVLGLKATFDNVLSDAEEALREAQAPIRQFVVEHPLASLLAVAGVATLLLRRPR